ncbi:MAG: S41 family peptidase [Bacilli bacterium]|nr:S41 family peptidase [Bacilli bacterium]
MNEEKNNKKAKIKKEESTATFNLFEVTIIILMTALVVAVSTGLVVYHNTNVISNNKFIGTGDYLEEFENAYNNILESYVEKVDEKGLINSAIQGMYNYVGDPYTSYLDPETTEDLTDRLNGQYEGIGVEITKVEEGILIVNVFENGPAKEAGLESGDIIIKVENNDVTTKTAAEVSNLIKTSKKSEVEISVLRGGITKVVTVNKKQVYIPSVIKSNYEGVGYLQITTFSDTTYEQFKTKLEELENEGIRSLVIDVRNNGGGYLNSAVSIAELFIEKGKNIYGLESKSGTTFYEDKTKTSRNYKVAVLMNNGSASASEILASALKESYNATLIGTTSYGKGTVQETAKLDTGGMIKVTTAYWLTPNGNKINGKGLKPDVELNGSYYENMPYEEDTQLQGAINAVK